MSVEVTSEIGSLQTVLVHTPGPELEAVTPGNREDFLYDDIIDLEIAQREHRQFVSVLKRFATVHQVRDLLAEILEEPEARDFLITKTMDVVPSDALAQQLGTMPAAQIVEMLIQGTREESGPITAALNEEGFAFPPLPNLFFPRDIGMVIGRHAVVGSMRYGVRWTEELLIKSLFLFHPELANAGLLYDGSEEKRSNYTLEGGDVHYLRHDLLVVGFSERTSPEALDRLCDVAFERGLATDVLVVVMPKAPTAIHLDMIFSHVDHELCVVYPPYFVGPERLAVLHRRKGMDGVREMPNFFAARQGAGPAAGADLRRGQRPHPPGAGAVELGMQLPRGAAGHDRELPPQRRDAVRAGAGGLPPGAGGQLPRLRRLARGQAPHRDHRRRVASWRGAAADPAACRCRSAGRRRDRSRRPSRAAPWWSGCTGCCEPVPSRPRCSAATCSA